MSSDVLRVIYHYRATVAEAARHAADELDALRRAGRLTERQYAYFADGFRPAADLAPAVKRPATSRQ